jgi:hypothetical protein
LSEEKILITFKNQTRDYWRDLIAGLSLLQVSLLIAIRNLLDEEIFAFNFELVYAEYKGIFARNLTEALEKAPKSLALKVNRFYFDTK